MPRTLLFTLVVAALAGGGYFWWLSRQPPPPPPVAAAPEEPRPPRADECIGANARYVLRTDKAIVLSMEQGGVYYAPTSLASQFSFYDIGHLTFVVTAPGKETHRFVLLKSLGYTGNYLFPVAASNRIEQPRLNDLIQVSMFDQNYDYFPNPPIGSSASPQHIFAPGIARWLHPASKHGGDIEMDMAFFDFLDCRTPAPQPAPAPAPTPAPAPP